MKKLLALLVFLTASSSVIADPNPAPESSVWTKIESFEVLDSQQIKIQGYVAGSTDLKYLYRTGMGPSLNHCERSIAMMMDKPGEYTMETPFASCILRPTK